ncbi:MAG: acyl CoA:acetate/3-ketoacid CoA transferase [Chloroflexi bacterium]|nr:acyl CoA:acetate/3-ketoacid CoA transferase [Chloroflexota bacterium]
MSRVQIISAEQAATLIPNDSIVAISSSSGLHCPDAILNAIGERFVQTGEPNNLTTFHPIASGDMYGIAGIDHLAKPGLLKRAIAGSYPSGPSSLPSPKIWQMINANQVEAYNFPSGILFHMLREAAAKRPGVLTQVGLDTFIDPRRHGGRMNACTPPDIVRVVEFDGQEWLYFKAMQPDVAIIRGTTADEFGNISMEHEGAYLGAYDVALAARNHHGVVIAQVKRLTTAGALHPQAVRVPGILVDYVVVVPDQWQTTQTPYDPAISGETRRPLTEFQPLPFDTDKIIARRAAMTLREYEAVNLGFGISALVPEILLEEGLHGQVTWVIEQGAVGGLPLTGFPFGCAVNAEAIVASPDQFTYFHGAGFDRSLLSFMQVDRDGNVNVSRLAARPHVTAGAGGFIDITAHGRRLVFSGYFTAGGLDLAIENGALRIVKEGKARKFTPQVEHVTFSGRRAREQGQDVTYITERCVMRLEPEGLTVIEIAPGIHLERDVLAQSDIPLRVSPELRTMDARLFRPERMGLVLADSR